MMSILYLGIADAMLQKFGVLCRDENCSRNIQPAFNLCNRKGGNYSANFSLIIAAAFGILIFGTSEKSPRNVILRIPTSFVGDEESRFSVDI
jgi:hypothetical protein